MADSNRRPLACQTCGTPCAWCYRGIQRDAQLGSCSVQTATLGQPSPEIVVTLVVNNCVRQQPAVAPACAADRRPLSAEFLLCNTTPGFACSIAAQPPALPPYAGSRAG